MKKEKDVFMQDSETGKMYQITEKAAKDPDKTANALRLKGEPSVIFEEQIIQIKILRQIHCRNLLPSGQSDVSHAKRWSLFLRIFARNIKVNSR